MITIDNLSKEQIFYAQIPRFGCEVQFLVKDLEVVVYRQGSDLKVVISDYEFGTYSEHQSRHH